MRLLFGGVLGATCCLYGCGKDDHDAGAVTESRD